MTTLSELAAWELRERYARRELSPVEVVDDLLARIERLDGPDRINAYVTVTPELAREQARAAERAYAGDGADALRSAPLLGVPISVKDTLLTRGVRTTFGSRLCADLIPDRDAVAVARARAAGAAILGKTNTSEMGWKAVTDNLLFGPTRNPWRHELTAGGSSGGAAAAVAAGLGPLALGTDAAGSLRIPAAFCGVVGFKATHGLVPTGAASLLGMVAHHGPIAATVADVALTLEAIAPTPGGWLDAVRPGAPTDGRELAGVRIGWCPTLGHGRRGAGEPIELAARLARALEEAGATVVALEPELPDTHDPLWQILAVATAYQHRDEIERALRECDRGRAAVIELGLRLSAVELAAALAARDELRAAVEALMADVDLLAMPTVPIAPFPLDLEGAERADVSAAEAETFAWTPNSFPFNLTGQPAISVPCGLTADGLPAGMQLVGRRGEDALTLRAAAAAERLRPWPTRAPLAEGADG